MIREEISGTIRVLVDHLRSNEKPNLNLADIASVTEILTNTMEAYFHSIDVSVYREFRDLSDYLANARLEIAKLSPGDLESVCIPRAGQELDAIVEATEAATHTIMEAAEEILSDDVERETIEAACMRIFEACSFQDITGQRISKVVATLEHVEHRMLKLKDVFEVENDDRFTPAEKTKDGDVVLAGPALEGEGMGQSEIDALLAEHDQKAKESAAKKTHAEVSEPAAAKAEPEPEKNEPAADEDEPKSDKSASQDDIDAMFG